MRFSDQVVSELIHTCYNSKTKPAEEQLSPGAGEVSLCVYLKSSSVRWLTESVLGGKARVLRRHTHQPRALKTCGECGLTWLTERGRVWCEGEWVEEEEEELREEMEHMDDLREPREDGDEGGVCQDH
ncbi:hypothetical protein E2C01_019614 [Portunus trituberculatus]|uniref:Uncharacterized protein n=1 Tax=Portunus trituberculatus TaxID=210409 RepID=A0A5B7DYS7_PORTR|nr:hypothetical protein [Portunus trituberculatus]